MIDLLENAVEIESKYNAIKSAIEKNQSGIELADQIAVLKNDFDSFNEAVSFRKFAFNPMSAGYKQFIERNFPNLANFHLRPHLMFDRFDIDLYDGSYVIRFIMKLKHSFPELINQSKNLAIKQLNGILEELPAGVVKTAVEYCF